MRVGGFKKKDFFLLFYKALDISFKAKNYLLFLCSTFHTLPNPPFPIT
jgi:hypothetical protein